MKPHTAKLEVPEPAIRAGNPRERDMSRLESRSITIDALYRGPLGMSNGGFTAGSLAKGHEGPMQVRLESPIPYGEVLTVRSQGNHHELTSGSSVLAVARPALSPVTGASFVEADVVRDQPRWEHGLEFFADCFVCGRAAPEGLGVELRQIDALTFAAVWRPSACSAVPHGPVPEEFLWAALDCPGGYAALASSSTLGLLGSIAVDIRFRPDASACLVVVGQATGVEGRKLGAATSIYTVDGEQVAAGSAVWVALKDAG
jgi:hypothetical protein